MKNHHHIRTDRLSLAEQAELAQLLEEQVRERETNKIRTYFPAKGPLRRALYPKHLMFFAAGGKHKPMDICPPDCKGKSHRERCFMAGNRTGKSEAGAYEVTLHLTGEYPDWWVGKRFDGPISAWAAGDISQTTRDIIQLKLLGEPGRYGTGMIPKRTLIQTTTKGGLSNAVETIYVRHVSGGKSDLGLKSFDQGRVAFQGTSKHVIWLDEECKREVYTECLLRTTNIKGEADFGGIIILTFTPMLGMTDISRDFLGLEISDGSDAQKDKYGSDDQYGTEEPTPSSTEL